MVVMQFGFEGPPSNIHRLENHPRRAVVYAGTHDCDTAVGWWRSLPRRVRARTGLPGREPHWELNEAALSSRAELAILQAQDILGLGTEARMNMPGTNKGNWQWQLRPGELREEVDRRAGQQRGEVVGRQRPPAAGVEDGGRRTAVVGHGGELHRSSPWDLGAAI